MGREGAYQVLTRVMKINNKLGFHARPASVFARTAAEFESEIYVMRGKLKVLGKSLMGLLPLCAPKGSEITVTAQGPDAEEAINRLQELVDGGFGEDV